MSGGCGRTRRALPVGLGVNANVLGVTFRAGGAFPDFRAPISDGAGDTRDTTGAVGVRGTGVLEVPAPDVIEVSS